MPALWHHYLCLLYTSRLYKVIYQAIEDVEAAMKGMLDPVFEEKVIGHAAVSYTHLFRVPAFAADFPPAAPEFHQRTHRVRLRNLGTTDKKSPRKIRYRKTPREHTENMIGG